MGIRRFVGKFGFDIVRIENRFVSLKSEEGNRGDVLLSYVIKPFLFRKGEPIPNDHTNYWESLQIARTFLDLGYNVDVIDYKNTIIHILEIQDTSEFLGFELPQRSTETVESQADSPTRDRSRTSVHSG